MKAWAHRNCVGVVTVIGPYIDMWCFYNNENESNLLWIELFFFWVSGTIENHEGMWMDVNEYHVWNVQESL